MSNKISEKFATIQTSEQFENLLQGIEATTSCGRAVFKAPHNSPFSYRLTELIAFASAKDSSYASPPIIGRLRVLKTDSDKLYQNHEKKWTLIWVLKALLLLGYKLARFLGNGCRTIDYEKKIKELEEKATKAALHQSIETPTTPLAPIKSIHQPHQEGAETLISPALPTSVAEQVVTIEAIPSPSNLTPAELILKAAKAERFTKEDFRILTEQSEINFTEWVFPIKIHVEGSEAPLGLVALIGKCQATTKLLKKIFLPVATVEQRRELVNAIVMCLKIAIEFPPVLLDQFDAHATTQLCGHYSNPKTREDIFDLNFKQCNTAISPDDPLFNAQLPIKLLNFYQLCNAPFVRHSTERDIVRNISDLFDSTERMIEPWNQHFSETPGDDITRICKEILKSDATREYIFLFMRSIINTRTYLDGLQPNKCFDIAIAVSNFINKNKTNPAFNIRLALFFLNEPLMDPLDIFVNLNDEEFQTIVQAFLKDMAPENRKKKFDRLIDSLTNITELFAQPCLNTKATIVIEAFNKTVADCVTEFVSAVPSIDNNRYAFLLAREIIDFFANPDETEDAKMEKLEKAFTKLKDDVKVYFISFIGYFGTTEIIKLCIKWLAKYLLTDKQQLTKLVSGLLHGIVRDSFLQFGNNKSYSLTKLRAYFECLWILISEDKVNQTNIDETLAIEFRNLTRSSVILETALRTLPSSIRPRWVNLIFKEMKKEELVALFEYHPRLFNQIPQSIISCLKLDEASLETIRSQTRLRSLFATVNTHLPLLPVLNSIVLDYQGFQQKDVAALEYLKQKRIQNPSYQPIGMKES